MPESAHNLAATPQAGPSSQPDAIITTDVPCLSCGYNLRTLRHSANCPECGTAVQRSVMGQWLRYAQRPWLGQLLLGAILLLVALCLPVPVVPLAMALSGGGYDAAAYFLLFLALGIPLIDTVGIFLITVRRNMPFWQERHTRLCLFLRAASLLCAVALLLMLVVPGPVAEWALLGLCLAVPARCVLLYAHLARLALRVPDPRLARTCRQIQWGSAITQATAVLAVVCLPLVDGLPAAMTAGVGSAVVIVLAIIAWTAALAAFLLLVVSLHVHIRIVQHLSAALRQARYNTPSGTQTR